MKIVTLSAIILISAGIISGAIIYVEKNQVKNTEKTNNSAINNNLTNNAEDKARKIETIKEEIELAKTNADSYKKAFDSTTAQINEINKRPAECQKMPVSLYYPCYSSYQTEFNRLTALAQDQTNKAIEYLNKEAHFSIELGSLQK